MNDETETKITSCVSPQLTSDDVGHIEVTLRMKDGTTVYAQVVVPWHDEEMDTVMERAYHALAVATGRE